MTIRIEGEELEDAVVSRFLSAIGFEGADESGVGRDQSKDEKLGYI